jgi:gamma-glutamyltranspeptidase
VVRISSRTWTLAQIEDLAVLIAAGSTAANAAVALRRSITVVRAKARNLGTPFQIIAEDRRRLKPSESFIYAPSRFRATHEV